MCVFASGFSEPTGQSWAQVGELLLAFALSSVIGLERQLRGKSAGLRTQTIVGTASALILLVSKYGFSDVLLAGQIAVDPSRVAAQIVSGIGFLGAGLIVTRRGAIHGLTTAAAVWETAAIGMAAGAGLPILAVVVTALHFVIVVGYTRLAARLPGGALDRIQLRVVYTDQQGVLRRLLAACATRHWVVLNLSVDDAVAPDGVTDLLDDDGARGGRSVTVTLTLSGPAVTTAPALLAGMTGVLAVDREVDDDSE